jgi:hypothetical protein
MTDSPVSDSPVSTGTSQPTSRRPVWLVVVVAVVVALALWKWRAGHATVDGSITLVSSDHDDLACASEQAFGRYRCEFRAPGVPWPDPPAPADRLAGYFTVEQKLYVIPGLFEQPVLAARYAAEEQRKVPRDQRPRFSAVCRLKITDQMRNLQTRWVKNGEWNHQDEAPVAIASDCRIQ